MNRGKRKYRDQKKVNPKSEAPFDIKIKSIPESEKSDITKGGGNENRPRKFNETQPPKNNKWTRTEHINLWLAIGTFLLFAVAIWQGNVASNAANAALKADSIIMKQFEVENTPYIGIDPVRIDTINNAVKEYGTFVFTIRNTGRGAIRIDTMAVDINFFDAYPYDTVIKNFYKHLKKITQVSVTNNISGGGTLTLYSRYEMYFNQAIIDDLMNPASQTILCATGQVKYFDLINNKRRRATFIIKLSKLKPINWEIIHFSDSL